MKFQIAIFSPKTNESIDPKREKLRRNVECYSDPNQTKFTHIKASHHVAVGRFPLNSVDEQCYCNHIIISDITEKLVFKLLNYH